jgi:signal transduction histidine kinase
MSFLDELRAHLRAVEVGAAANMPSADVDLAAVRFHFLATLRRFETSGEEPALSSALLHLRTSGVWFERFVACAERELRRGLCFGSDATMLQRHLCEVIDEMCLRGDAASIAPDASIRSHELVRILREAERYAAPSALSFLAEDYAFENRLVRGGGARAVISPLGRVLLDLPGIDAIRWLLTVEWLQCVEADPHPYQEALSELLAVPSHARWAEGIDEPDSTQRAVFYRLSNLGAVSRCDGANGIWGYDLVPAYRETVESLVSGRRTPLVLLAESLLTEERASIGGHASTLPSPEFAAELQARHARMVVHEIRNKIVPMSMALSGIFRTLQASAPAEQWQSQRVRVESGLDHLLRFAEDLEQVAHLANPAQRPFDAVAAIEDAIKGLNGGLGLAVTFEPNAGLPPLVGHRPHFTLAVVNLLRNAAQNNPRPGAAARLRVSIDAACSAIELTIDDNGPGVPSEHREEIFRRGYALRPGGSGQGLALVREVIEREMRGTVRCEASELGGARFVILFPIASKEIP